MMLVVIVWFQHQQVTLLTQLQYDMQASDQQSTGCIVYLADFVVSFESSITIKLSYPINLSLFQSIEMRSTVMMNVINFSLLLALLLRRDLQL